MTSRPRLARSGLAGALAIAGAGAAALLYQHSPGWMYDLTVYRRAASAVLHGQAVYTSTPPAFTYPPFAALLFVPFSLLPAAWAGLLWTAISLFCLQASVWLSLGSRASVLTAGAACLLAVWLDPVSLTLLLGQVNLILLALVLSDLLLLGGSRWLGLITGVAAGIKLTPAIFIVYLALSGRLRAAALAATSLAATVVIGLLVLPRDALRYWGGTFLDSSRVGWPQNVRSQSLLSLLVRWAHATQGVGPAWLALSLGMVAIGLSVAVRAHRRGEELLAACLCGTTALLIEPITWQHHWVWMLPWLLWLGQRAWRERSPVLAAIAAGIAIELFVRPYQWGIPIDRTADLRLGLPQLLQSSTYAATAIGVLALAAVTLRVRRPTTRRLRLTAPAADPRPP
jgi:alpha-1,2-mannosyltransferase